MINTLSLTHVNPSKSDLIICGSTLFPYSYESIWKINSQFCSHVLATCQVNMHYGFRNNNNIHHHSCIVPEEDSYHIVTWLDMKI